MTKQCYLTNHLTTHTQLNVVLTLSNLVATLSSTSDAVQGHCNPKNTPESSTAAQMGDYQSTTAAAAGPTAAGAATSRPQAVASYIAAK
jgi:hypothetical protein